jgi:hypothetical protein
MYLYVIQSLREFGMSLDKLKKVKEQLYQTKSMYDWMKDDPEDTLSALSKMNLEPQQFKKIRDVFNSDQFEKKMKETQVSFLKALIFGTLRFGVKSYICVFVTGDVFMFNEVYYDKKVLDELDNTPRIIIPVERLLREFLAEEFSFEFVSRYKVMNDRELQILEQLRKNNVKHILITYKKGEPERIKVTEVKRLDIYARLNEVLRQRDFQTLTVKTNDGNIVYSTIETEKML